MIEPSIPANETERLEALYATGILDTPPDPDLDELVRLAATLCRTPMAIVSLVDRDRQWLKAKLGLDMTEGPRRESFCGHVVAGGDPLIVENARSDHRFFDHPSVVSAPFIDFYAGFPLTTEGGHTLGTLCVLDRVPRTLEVSQVEALSILARQAAALIELHRKSRELQVAKERLDDILDNATDLVQSVTRDGRFRYVNRAWREALGYGEEEIAALHDLDVVAPERREVYAAAIARALNEGRARQELELVTRYGERLEVEGVFTARTLAGLVPGVRAILRDISQRRAIDRMKNELISTVSHELRTPLTSIRGSLALLGSGLAGELPPDSRELVTIAHENTERLIRLVNDMLDLEKIEAGKLELHLTEVAGRKVVETAIDSVRGMATGSKVELAAEVTEVVISADFDRLVQVLVNLLSNAIKFSPSGARVLVRVRATPERVRWEVEDSGPGIPAHQHARLFGKFEQLGTAEKKKGGTGLGLAISKAIVERHGGVIGVEDRAPCGSTFWFELPRPAAP